MQLDDLAADVEPQTHTGHGRERPAGVRLVEAIEDMCPMLELYAHTSVAYGEVHLPVLGSERDVDLAAVGAVLYGVVDQVGHHLLDAQWINVEHEVADIGRFALQRQLAGLNP